MDTATVTLEAFIHVLTREAVCEERKPGFASAQHSVWSCRAELLAPSIILFAAWLRGLGDVDVLVLAPACFAGS
jgi:hypothetical protein